MEWSGVREGSAYFEAVAEIVGGLRPSSIRPSSANFLRAFVLCNVDLSISPRRQNASLRVSISCELLNCILMGTEPMTVTAPPDGLTSTDRGRAFRRQKTTPVISGSFCCFKPASRSLRFLEFPTQRVQWDRLRARYRQLSTYDKGAVRRERQRQKGRHGSILTFKINCSSRDSDGFQRESIPIEQFYAPFFSGDDLPTSDSRFFRVAVKLDLPEPLDTTVVRTPHADGIVPRTIPS